MPISFASALGIHEQALMLRESRAQLLANNLANSDTPNFQARDIDFRRILRDAASGRASSKGLRRSHENHMSAGGLSAGTELLYRTPMQPSLDGNTVDEQLEMVQFASNALEFQASLDFVQRRLRGLKSAIGDR